MTEQYLADLDLTVLKALADPVPGSLEEKAGCSFEELRYTLYSLRRLGLAEEITGRWCPTDSGQALC